MKKPLAALLLSAATVAALAVPAGAATTPKPKKHLFAALPCSGTNHSKTARIWRAPSGWIASNPCNLWLLVGFSDPSAGGSNGEVVNIAPHVYSARWGFGGPQVNAVLRSTPDHCGASSDIGKDGKLRNTSGDPGAPGC